MFPFPFQPQIIIAQSTGVFPCFWWELDGTQNELVWQGAEDRVENRDSGEGLKQQSLKQPFIANDISQQKNFFKLCFISTTQFREALQESRNAAPSWCLCHSRTQLLAEVRVRYRLQREQHWQSSGILCVCTAPHVPQLFFLFLGHSWTWKWYCSDGSLIATCPSCMCQVHWVTCT